MSHHARHPHTDRAATVVGFFTPVLLSVVNAVEGEATKELGQTPQDCLPPVLRLTGNQGKYCYRTRGGYGYEYGWFTPFTPTGILSGNVGQTSVPYLTQFKLFTNLGTL